ncbi:MAG TPA: large-conductance mechanosensitive channel protein MscL [Saprospiraceae bacterium]|nr:large-conductance mechanosensitive channel protein MscL [Saprospiraceae bacterium]
MRKLIKDFKEFAVKGNLIDLAIGIIIGTAFNKIVSALVENVIMPPFGLVFGQRGMAQYQWVLRAPQTDASGAVIEEAVVLSYGIFLQACLDFLIVAFTIFVVVRVFNRLRNQAEDEEETKVPTPKNIQLMAEMRDLMKEQGQTLKKIAEQGK